MNIQGWFPLGFIKCFTNIIKFNTYYNTMSNQPPLVTFALDIPISYLVTKP